MPDSVLVEPPDLNERFRERRRQARRRRSIRRVGILAVVSLLAAAVALGAVVLGVSADTEKTHQKFTEKHGLNFPLLADVNHEIAEKYGA